MTKCLEQIWKRISGLFISSLRSYVKGSSNTHFPQVVNSNFLGESLFRHCLQDYTPVWRISRKPGKYSSRVSVFLCKLVSQINFSIIMVNHQLSFILKPLLSGSLKTFGSCLRGRFYAIGCSQNRWTLNKQFSPGARDNLQNKNIVLTFFVNIVVWR